MALHPTNERSREYWVDFGRLNGKIPRPKNAATPAEAAGVIVALLDELEAERKKVTTAEEKVREANRKMEAFRDEVTAALSQSVQRCRALA